MMLDLDNLDLDLDEDFSTSPLESTLFDSSFTSSLSRTVNRNSEKPTLNKALSPRKENAENVQEKNTAIDPVLELLESTQKNEVKNISKNNLNTSDVFNTSFSPSKIFKNDKDDLNISNDYGKRILTHRKFPGPAGLLPDKPLKDLSVANIIVDKSSENVSAERQKESVILCSQTSSVYTEASFKKLASDFDLMKDNCPLNKYTVDWVKKRAVKKTLSGKKIPFLAVILHNVDHGTPDPIITLRDQTGEIYGTLHREVWSELGGKLQPGAALALKQVGVLITGIARRQVHLNITSNNIMNIYSYGDEGTVETTCVTKFDKSDLTKSVDESHVSVPKVGTKVPSNPFSTIGGNKLFNVQNSFVKTVPQIKSSAPNNFSNQKMYCQQPNRTTTESPSYSKSDEPKNCINFATSMDDDISDFIASLDENDLCEQFLGGMKDSSEVRNKESDSNCKKRKMDSEDVFRSNKALCPSRGESGFVPSEKNTECKEKVIITSKPLSQAESQIVEEVLDGIDFDEF